MEYMQTHQRAAGRSATVVCLHGDMQPAVVCLHGVHALRQRTGQPPGPHLVGILGNAWAPRRAMHGHPLQCMGTSSGILSNACKCLLCSLHSGGCVRRPLRAHARVCASSAHTKAYCIGMCLYAVRIASCGVAAGGQGWQPANPRLPAVSLPSLPRPSTAGPEWCSRAARERSTVPLSQTLRCPVLGIGPST